MLKRFFVMGSMLALAACDPAGPMSETPSDSAAPAPQAEAPAPYVTPPVTLTKGGLQEREPDTCGAVNYTSVLGQPAAQIQTLGITKPYRIVEWRGVEDQVYNPQRVVFRLDSRGNVYNIDCG
ncbi:peptidase inhibitor I78 family protein [Thioclava sp. ES.031]|uniref:I78 family peptidase inhibitor n=1 Tax=Thioclava sp. ES.031 TaxID=1798203 RepID=UPI000BF66D10|nr:I78 family peptidase inhibitor [Thioclava sp. ES.031]PFG64133.1 peptidase inhibitor I78 family protein [Thioclava sp. ES.031]